MSANPLERLKACAEQDARDLKAGIPLLAHDELDRWARQLPLRRELEDFLDWLSEQRIEPCGWQEGARWPVPLTEGRASVLNRYMGIDAKRLDEQRRALLERYSR